MLNNLLSLRGLGVFDQLVERLQHQSRRCFAFFTWRVWDESR
jgi:hypothetical protein